MYTHACIKIKRKMVIINTLSLISHALNSILPSYSSDRIIVTRTLHQKIQSISYRPCFWRVYNRQNTQILVNTVHGQYLFGSYSIYDNQTGAEIQLT